jgi:hypothetical protein
MKNAWQPAIIQQVAGGYLAKNRFMVYLSHTMAETMRL